MIDLLTIGADVPGVHYNADRNKLSVPQNALALVRQLGVPEGVRIEAHQQRAALRTLSMQRASFPGARERVRRPGDEKEMWFFPATGEESLLTPYQVEGVQIVLERGFGILRWPTGSGKSVATILLLLAQPGPGVIVCRATQRLGFMREIARYADVKVQLIEGEAEVAIDPATRLVVIGWETLPFHAGTIINTLPGYSVMFDEIHRGKNRKRHDVHHGENGAVSFKARKNIAGAALALSRSALFRGGATATPISDRPGDLWTLIDLVEPGSVGNWKTYSARYCKGHVNTWGGWEAKGAANEDQLALRLKTVLHDVPEAVVDAYLPPRRFMFTPLSSDEQCSAGAFAAELKAASKQGEAAVRMSQRMQAAARKRPAILARIEEIVGEKKRIAVFTGRKLDVLALESAARKALPKDTPVFVLTGDDTMRERVLVIDQYRACEGGAVLIGTGQSIGESVDGLQTTDWAIFAMLPDTPGELKQWSGRFHRHGQRHGVVIELPYALGTYDEQIVGRLADKLPALVDVVGDASMGELAKGFAGDDKALAKSLASKILAMAQTEEDDTWERT